ncbi:MAG TPA: M23 family metallopeptidase, partial [Pseudobdellovibrionaceae bacterium]|nr:M23 family metallopeptidase [Pseudobdellovibrionaceae bacterium]
MSNDSGKTRKIVLPLSWVKVSAFIASIFLIILFAGIVDYFGLLIQVLENKKLKFENAQLQKQFQVVESKVDSLENSLERVRNFTTKLKLITNIDAEDRIAKLTMGPGPSKGEQLQDVQPMETRMSSEKMAEQDQVYDESDPSMVPSGELVSEKSDSDYSSLVIRIDQAVGETQLKEQSVIDLWEALSERQSLLSSTPNIKPAKGWLASGFGYRISPFSGKKSLHAGLDIAAAPGSPVFAPAQGVVVFASYDETYGKLITIDHGYGVTTRYGHLSQIYVQLGQRVNKWDVVGAVGNTGRSTGPHLHYEVRVQN